MLGLVILIVVLACVLAYVPGMPPPARMLVTITLIVLCVVLLLDVLGVAVPLTGGHRLLC